jgi:transposase
MAPERHLCAKLDCCSANEGELVEHLNEPGSVPEPLLAVLPGLAQLLAELDRQIAAIDARILAWHRANQRSQALATIPGFGPILASAMGVRVAQPERFGNGRDLAVWIGLVPKQASSGDTVRLSRISKQGDTYLRRLLLNGAPAVLNGQAGQDRSVDRPSARLEAAAGRRRGAGQQDGAHRLGGDGAPDPLPPRSCRLTAGGNATGGLLRRRCTPRSRSTNGLGQICWDDGTWIPQA